MKVIANWQTTKCYFEIIKIQNGYLVKISGTDQENENYMDCIFYSTKEETFNQFKFFVTLAGGNVKYDIDSVEW